MSGIGSGVQGAVGSICGVTTAAAAVDCDYDTLDMM